MFFPRPFKKQKGPVSAGQLNELVFSIRDLQHRTEPLINDIEEPGRGRILGKILGETAGLYTWDEWEVYDGTLAVKPGGIQGRVNGFSGWTDPTQFPAKEINGTTGITAGTYAWMEPTGPSYASGQLPQLNYRFVNPSAGGRGSDFGWVAGLISTDCLTVSSDGATSFTLSTSDGLTWDNASEVLTICGADYEVTFTRGACDGPCLTLTSATSSATSYSGTQSAADCSYAEFKFSKRALCPATTRDVRGPCYDTVTVRVDWASSCIDCCPERYLPSTIYATFGGGLSGLGTVALTNPQTGGSPVGLTSCDAWGAYPVPNSCGGGDFIICLYCFGGSFLLAIRPTPLLGFGGLGVSVVTCDPFLATAAGTYPSGGCGAFSVTFSETSP